MANYSELLNDINAAIYENNDQEIDALEVRAILREMVTSLGSGFLFKGIATPSSPGTSQAPDQNVFYLATTAGTYTYLGGLVVAAGEVAFLCFDGTWTKKSSALLSTGSIVDNLTTADATKPLSAKQGKVLADAGAATAAEVTALGQKVRVIWGMYLDSRSGRYIDITLTGDGTGSSLSVTIPAGYYLVRNGQLYLSESATATLSGQYYYVIVYDHSDSTLKVINAMSSITTNHSVLAIVGSGYPNATPIVKCMTPAYMFNGTLMGGFVPDASITTAKLAAGAVTSGKIGSAAVTPGKLENGTRGVLDSYASGSSATPNKITYESDGANIYITDIRFLIRGGINVSITNLSDLYNALGLSQYDVAPSGANSIKIANQYKLVFRSTDNALKVVSRDNITQIDFVILACAGSGIIEGGAFVPLNSVKNCVEGYHIVDGSISTAKIANEAVTKQKLSQDILSSTIGKIDHTFTFAATAGTYISSSTPYTFINGHRYKIVVSYPVGISYHTYFSVRSSGGSALQNTLLYGNASREGVFTCSVDGGEKWYMTIVEAHDSALSFDAYIIDLDALTIAANREMILDIAPDIPVVSLNGKNYVENILTQAKQVARVRSGGTATNGEAQLVLLWLSDIHGDQTNMARILEFYSAYSSYFNDILCTGDMIEDKWADDMTWWASVEADDVLVTIGNHDVNNPGGTAITAVQAYDRYIGPYVSGWGVTQPANAATNGYNYYYKDYAGAKMRLICLDVMFWDATQNTWLQGVLASAKTAGYAVIIAQHYPLTAETPEDTGFNSLYSISINWASSAIASVQDFIDGGGEFVCWLVGHQHLDFFGALTSNPDQLVITIANASLNNYWGDTARISGEKSQDLFNIIAFDFNQKMIKMARIGADYDRLLRHKGTLCYKYDTHELIQG